MYPTCTHGAHAALGLPPFALDQKGKQEDISKALMPRASCAHEERLTVLLGRAFEKLESVQAVQYKVLCSISIPAPVRSDDGQGLKMRLTSPTPADAHVAPGRHQMVSWPEWEGRYGLWRQEVLARWLTTS